MWMLLGKASTVYFPEAALQLLEDFDADLPYIITDSVIWTNSSGAALPDEALRCLPCHFDDSDEMLRLSQGAGSTLSFCSLWIKLSTSRPFNIHSLHLSILGHLCNIS